MTWECKKYRVRQALLSCARVLMAVSDLALDHTFGLRALDGTSLVAHLWMIYGLLRLPANSCTQEELVHAVRGVAEVLLQTTARLQQVRARHDTGLPAAGALGSTLL